MKIRFIKDFNGIKKGTVSEISDFYGMQHIKAGNAVDANAPETTENVSRETIEPKKPKSKKNK